MKIKLTLLFFFFTLLGFAQEIWRPVGADDFNMPSLGAIPSGSAALDCSKMVVKNNHVFVFNLESGDFTNGELRYVISKYSGSLWEHIETPFVGSTDFGVAVDNNDLPYLFFTDQTDNNKTVVKKYDGSNWVTVGDVVFDAPSDKHTIVIGSDNVPYVVYHEDFYTSRVKKFDGTHWVSVGTTAEISPSHSFSLALDNNNIPYLIYDLSNTGAFVKKFNGTAWEEVGITDFSGARKAIAFDNNNMLYVYVANALRKFNGNSWETVIRADQLGAASDTYQSVSIQFDDQNLMHVGYMNTSLLGKSIKKFQNGSWQSVVGRSSYENLEFGFVGNQMYIQWIPFYRVPTVERSAGLSFEIVGHQSELSGASMYRNFYHDLTFNEGTPYVSFKDYNSAAKMTVRKFNGDYWENAGNQGFSETEIHNSKIETAPNGTLYAGYLTDLGSSINHDYRITIRKLNGNSWDLVGPVNFSLSAGFNFDLKINHANEPHVVYRSGRVQKFNGTSWEFVGSSIFPNDMQVELAFDQNDIPYVAFEDPANGNAIAVKKYNGSPWEYVGQSSLTAFNNSLMPKIIFDSNNNPYVAFLDNSNKIHIKKFDGTDWQTVGSETINTGFSDQFALAIDHNNVPYVFYNEAIDTFRKIGNVKKFNGADWESVGPQHFTPSGAFETHMDFSANNTPFVTYMQSSGIFSKYFGEYNSWLGVDEHDETDLQSLTVIPNPVSDVFSIRGNIAVNSVEIYDLPGPKVFTNNEKSDTVDVSHLPSGIYLVKMQTDKGIKSIKFIKK